MRADFSFLFYLSVVFMNIIEEIINGKILEIHGEFATGKTNLALHLANLIGKKQNVFYIFTEDFPKERFEKICRNNVIPIKVYNFLDMYEYTKKLINNGVLVYDSFTYFYRLNRDDNILENILKKLKLSKFGSILINQVRENIDKSMTIPIAWHKISKYCDIVFELKKEPRRILIRKPIRKTIYFDITEKNIIFKKTHNYLYF